ncbi:MAG: NAD(P)/FAD-dependent oxidoreductase [Gemmatimonadaceae bacterium]
MSNTADVLVLGGGIAGLTVALEAARRDLSVIILDSPRPGAASRAAAGMLAPSVEELPTEMRDAAISARDHYPSFLAELRELTGIDVPLDRGGILQLVSESDSEPLRRQAPAGAEWLDSAALADREPAFGGHHGALLHPLDGAVDNVLLMDALERAVAGTAAIRRVGADVLSIDADQPSALTPTRGRFFATRLVLSTGAWAGSLPGLPRRIPVRPVRGQLLRLAQSPIRHVTYGAGGYLVPRVDTVLIGATSEEAGFENETSLAGLSALRSIASRAIPALANALVVDHWAGLRPMSLDTHPILGADPESPALVYACGYSRNGILFAPWAAAQLANVLVGDPASELAPFQVDRPQLIPAGG